MDQAQQEGLKLASVAFFLLDLDGGGAERSIVALAASVASRGHVVDLLVGDASSDYRDEVSACVNLIDFSTRSPVLVFCRLVAYLRKHKPIVVMSALDLSNIMVVLAAVIAGFRGRTVLSQRAVIAASQRELGIGRRLITRLLQRFCFPMADALISNSHAAAREVEAQLAVPGDRVFTIHNALDIERIERLAAEPLRGYSFLADDVPMVVSVGSLTKRKDMATLIGAFARVRAVRAAHLVIIGKGEEQVPLEALIADLGLQGAVHLIGFDVNPYKWMAAAAAVVSSSTEEGFPNVIAEALALGRPIVATDCPGDTAELLCFGRWGRLVPVGDPGCMAGAIHEALDDPSPPDGRIRAADFSPTRTTSAYLDVLLPKGIMASRTARRLE
jgi:glycosyltransferase involved in cell wall biosynthesis